MSVQLAATGKADVYISGSPSVTYFSSVYLKATPFVKQTIEIPFDNQPIVTSSSGICSIPNAGDIITDITLKTVLPVLNQPSSLGTFYWPNTSSQTVQIFADYGAQNGFGFFSLPISGTVTTTGSTFPATSGYWGYCFPTYNAVGTGAGTFSGYSNLFTVSFNQSTLTFTVNCPTSTATFLFNNFQFVQSAVTSSGSGIVSPSGTALPVGIQFLDQNSANFFGFSQLNTVYPFVNGSVTGNPISQTGWIYGNGIVPNTNYYDEPGTRLIQQSTLYIGAQTISTIKGPYIDLMNDVEVPYENQVALTQLIGKNDSTSVVLPRYLYTKLNFGLKNIPICALGRHDTQVEVDFNPLLSAQLQTSNTITASLLVEFAFVSDRERDWFTKSRHSYVYEQVLSTSPTIKAGDNYIKLDKIILNPVKEIYILVQSSATSYTYADVITNAVILFNDQELINYPAQFFKTILPFETKTVMPTRVMYMYAFNGPVNFSRISDIKLKLTASSGPYTCLIYAKTLNVLVTQNEMGGFIFS